MDGSSSGVRSNDSKTKQKHPIFNREYEILSSLGEGNTSKVYLCRSLKDPKKKIALKLLREEFLQRDGDSIKSVEQEIQILQGLTHTNIVSIQGYGSDGYVKKPSGREIKNLVYILLEYIPGGLLFDLCQTCGGMGEDAGRYFLTQMLDVLGYMQSKNVVHRDLKLENILVDDQINLKVADFGFATYKKINKLKSYRGTMTYMAPEIKEGKQYDGRQIDIFSTGVILFIIVQGIFPFKEAKKDEYFYNLILNNKLDTYWKKVGGNNLSDEFKDLILRMFSYDGNKRPTIDQLKAHPWINKPFSVKLTRSAIIDRLNEKRSEKTNHMSKDDDGNKNYRGGEMKELVRQASADQLELYKFNDLVDHDIEVMPGTIWEELNMFNEDLFEGKLTLDYNQDKQYMTIEMSNPETGELDFLVKGKFFALNNTDEGEAPRLRLRLVKKKGDL